MYSRGYRKTAGAVFCARAHAHSSSAPVLSTRSPRTPIPLICTLEESGNGETREAEGPSPEVRQRCGRADTHVFRVKPYTCARARYFTTLCTDRDDTALHILPVAGRVTRDIILMCGLLRGSTLEGLHAAGWERLFLFFKLHALPRRSTEVLRVLLGPSDT